MFSLYICAHSHVPWVVILKLCPAPESPGGDCWATPPDILAQNVWCAA